MREYAHFIGNTWREGGNAAPITRENPATGSLVATFAQGSAAEVEMAVGAARAAFETGPWPRMTAQERASVLFRLADLIEANKALLSDIEVAEVGKPRRFVENDVASAIAFTRHAASMAAQFHGEAYTNLTPEKTGLVLRQPVGVVGIIIPWNFPIEIFGKKVPFALASGCTVVVKPSELTSGSALEVARLAEEAGVPPGVLNIVTGYGADVGEALTLSPGVDMVSFTGSTAVGQRILRNSAETIKRVTLELGGKSANMVFDDADIESAVEGTLFAIFAFQGQCCVAGTRLLLQEGIADAFLGRLVARVSELRIGDPASAATDLGSMISAVHTERVMGFVERACGNGGKLVVGGDRTSPAEGLTDNFVAPTIFDGVSPESEIFAQEIFGPVLSVTRFASTEEAIALANRTAYGLANTLWTRSLETAMTVSRAVKSGLVWVNTTLDGAPQLPFGGVKASGFGRELGNAGFEDFTELKTVLLSTAPFTTVFPRAA
jgi:betaine-aldehyde dehydrogenase